MLAIEANDRPLFRALDMERGVTAFVGGGGKTTSILRIARELAGLGRVLVTTSTHMYPPDTMPVLTEASVSDVRAALALACPVCVGRLEASGKIAAPSIPFTELAELADYVLVEADGAKGLPLKAPAAHEPVLPENTSLVVAVAGLDGIGRTIAQAAFRPALYAAALGCGQDHIVTPADVALVLCDDRGQYKAVREKTRFAVLLNKADDASLRALALAVIEQLDVARVERAVVTSCKEVRVC